MCALNATIPSYRVHSSSYSFNDKDGMGTGTYVYEEQ